MKRKKLQKTGRRKKKNSFFLLPSTLIFSFFLFLGCSNPDNWLHSLPKPWTLSEEKVSEILPQFHQKFPDFHDRLKAFALWQVGKPYELFCLGEEAGQDTDPIFRLDVSDCTVHVLTSLASVQSQDWDEAKANLIEIHYKPGKDGKSIPTFQSRWHYTSDRIQENPFTQNITDSLVEPKDLETVDIVLNQKSDGSEFLDLGWEKKTTISYIPSESINSVLLEKLPSITGVAFVKKAWFKMGLVVAHEGMIIDQRNIIHASSEYGKTVNMDFMKYYFREDGPLFDGLLFYSFHPLGD